MSIGVLLAAALIALIYSLNHRDSFTMAIMFVQVIAVLLPYAGFGNEGQGLGLISLLIIIVYPIVNDEVEMRYKICIWLFVIPYMILCLLDVMRIPWSVEMMPLLLIPLAVFIFAIFKREKLAVEISFMIMIVASILLRLISVI